MADSIEEGWGRRWDLHFMRQAHEQAIMSKDPRTQVGAVLVDEDRVPRSSGFNGFPRGIGDTAARLGDRGVKNSLMVHAERNCVANAARTGSAIRGAALYYVACHEEDGDCWGGAPCVSCTIELIQVGLRCVACFRPKGFGNWCDEVAEAERLLAEAGVRVRYVDRPGPDEYWPDRRSRYRGMRTAEEAAIMAAMHGGSTA